MNEKHLQRQIARLKNLPRIEAQEWGDAKNPGLRDELLRVLWIIANDDDHARQIIDRVMDSKPADGKPQFCPTPGVLKAVAETLEREREAEYEVHPTKCNHCGDSGFRQVVRIVHGERYEAAIPCECKGVPA